MTAIRESQSASTSGNGAPEWGARSAFSTNGVPLWGAVLLAAVPTAIGTVLDTLIWKQPGFIFKTCFFLGCLAAVLLVQRRSVFGPMVQPPLVLGIVMPLLVLITGSGSASGAGFMGKALSVARPLITSFPIMAGATAVALGIGLLRMFVTQKVETDDDDFDLGVDPDAKTKKARPVPPPRRKSARDEAPRKRPASDRERKPSGDQRKPRDDGRGGDRRAEPRGTGPREAQGRPKGDSPRRGDVPGRPRPNDPRAGGPRPPRQGGPGRPRPPEPPPGGRPRRPGP
ncbi:hypothetical protein E1161_03860 [Saccharopolyspora aridisoli]|uniref:DUF6542 domain-containing protein n=1 Tax=Saccharopolyspora aridisoli TaxID=2530385 RepID=A0A4R4V3H3_9PSEU|nr:DUF6542 domain-containing protein [Saccharopolyspora aridisoli]TDC95913.1 hypothetical protein E1161_03860 [Saccharopolyspora aridisoli]